MRLACLYPVINVTDAHDEERALALATILAKAGVPLLQLRYKPAGSGDYRALATRLVKRLRPLGCSLLINDRPDVALLSAAAGVHLGQDDLPVEAARKLLGDNAIIGLSSHRVEEVETICASAAARRLNYLAFGPVFDSPTKAGVRGARGLDALAEACRVSTLPVVAIGGITIDRAASIRAAGASAAAVISEFERADDPARLAEMWLDEFSD